MISMPSSKGSAGSSNVHPGADPPGATGTVSTAPVPSGTTPRSSAAVAATRAMSSRRISFVSLTAGRSNTSAPPSGTVGGTLKIEPPGGSTASRW